MRVTYEYSIYIELESTTNPFKDKEVSIICVVIP